MDDQELNGWQKNNLPKRWMKGDLINSPNRNILDIKQTSEKPFQNKSINTKMNDMNRELVVSWIADLLTHCFSDSLFSAKIDCACLKS